MNKLPVQTWTCKRSRPLSEMTEGETQIPNRIDRRVKERRRLETLENRESLLGIFISHNEIKYPY